MKIDYNSLIALVISPIAIILGIFCLIGSTSTNSVSTGIYQLQLDFTNVNFTKLIYLPKDNGITASFTHEEVGISQIYRIGLNSYCRGNKTNGKLKFTSCVQNFSPDPAAMLLRDIRKRENPLLRNISILSISFPYDVADFSEEPYRSNSKSCMYTTIIGVILAGIAFVFYILHLSLSHSIALISLFFHSCFSINRDI